MLKYFILCSILAFSVFADDHQFVDFDEWHRQHGHDSQLPVEPQLVRVAAQPQLVRVGDARPAQQWGEGQVVQQGEIPVHIHRMLEQMKAEGKLDFPGDRPVLAHAAPPAQARVRVAPKPQAAPQPQVQEKPKEQKPKSGGGTMDTEFVDQHNEARKKEGAHPALPKMTWDKELAALAQATVNKCVFEHDHQGQKTSKHKSITQNLYYNHGTTMSPKAGAKGALDLWMSEKPNWSFAGKKCLKGMCGHYTQVVWRDTIYVGCGISNGCPGEKVYIACDYAPPGNYKGKNPY